MTAASSHETYFQRERRAAMQQLFLVRSSPIPIDNDPRDLEVETWMHDYGRDLEIGSIAILIQQGMTIPPANDGLWGDL